jgi:hypothetical protein
VSESIWATPPARLVSDPDFDTVLTDRELSSIVLHGRRASR